MYLARPRHPEALPSAAIKARLVPTDSAPVTAMGSAHSADAARGTRSEVARLTALWRLTLGAAHTLNNSLAAILGEASCLLDDRKNDAEVVEACERIQQEVDRCARLTRALLARHDPHQNDADEVNLPRLVGDLAPMLRETLSRRFELTIALPEDLLLVQAPIADLESLLLLLIHRCCDRFPEGGCLRIALEPAAAGTVRLSVEIEPTEAPPAAKRRWRSPEPCFDLDAARSLSEPYGARIELAETNAGLRLSAVFRSTDIIP